MNNHYIQIRRASAGYLLAFFLAVTGIVQTMRADDWPQWMGPKRDNVWREKGILEKFPTNGLKVLWRTNVNQGYCGPAVVGNRLYMMDRLVGPKLTRKPGDKSVPAAAGNERVLCLDAKTGAKVWEHVYDCPYRIGYPSGPRATPVVAGGRIYTLGAMGDLLCLNAKNGKLIWERHFMKDFEMTEPPTWGFAAHPVLDGNQLICLVGGSNSVVRAFDKNTGKDVWHALNSKEIGYAPVVPAEINGKKQLVVWDTDELAGLESGTGKVLWDIKYPVEGKAQRPEVSIATPRISGNQIFVSSFYHGALLLAVTNHSIGVGVVWNRHSSSNSEMNDGLHTVMCTPLFEDNHIYGVCGSGELRCLDGKNGDRLWESDGAVGGKPGLFANAFLIKHEDKVFIWNDQGELILAKLSPKGFEEIGKSKLLETSENTRGRDIVWCHPAFANRCMYVHNGKELICVSLAAKSSGRNG